MYSVRKVKDDMYWVGANDRRLALFENVFPIPRGVSYNSYLVLDEKTVLIDAVDSSAATQFFENIEYVLGERKLDYLIVNHMEPDHGATVQDVLRRYQEATLVCNDKTLKMIKQFFNIELEGRVLLVKESDTLSTGKHCFSFVSAPMVHWPEVMLSYDATDKILYSADAFGTFGALSGNIFADEVDFEKDWMPDARRYYTNIVGKYGAQVRALLKKAEGIEIGMICPLHGPIWREKLSQIIEKYKLWSSYEPEERGVLIAYASVYGNTKSAAELLAIKLAEKGIRNIAMYDVSSTHPSVIVAEAFRYSHIVIASTTYNAGIFVNMEMALLDLKAHNIQNRTIAIMENGSWAPTAAALIKKMLGGLKSINILEKGMTLLSSMKENQIEELEAMAEAVADSVLNNSVKEQNGKEDLPKKKYVCRICGYVYEGDELPADFRCPLCRRGAEDFELQG